MFRKSICAVAAIATIAAASLVPTTASAHGFKGGWGWGGGWGYRSGIILAAPLAYGCASYVVTPSGYLKKVWGPCY